MVSRSVNITPMKQSKTLRIETYKRELTKLLNEHPEARRIAQRYKVLAYVLNKEHPNLISKNESWDNFLHDVLYIDRLIRRETEGIDDDIKEELSNKKKIELGYKE